MLKRISKSIKRAFKATREEMLFSLAIVVVVTVFLSGIFFIIERKAQPDVFSGYPDAFVWAYSRYIEGGDAVFEGGPVTAAGKFIAAILGLVGIAIVAGSAGLVGSGFTDAMKAEKRDLELESFHKQMRRAFKAGSGRLLKDYIARLPQSEDAWYSGCDFGYINNNVAVSKFELKDMNLKDILETCKEYPDFRVKNEASAVSVEDERTDRYVLEHYPVNRRYGFFVNRGSKVTIVSTSSKSELGIGNFSYYLAKFAGFNYISKDFDAADGESYFNNDWAEPFYEGVTLKDRVEAREKISKELRRAYENKAQLRKEFLQDLESLCRGEDTWAICLLSHVKNQDNNVDIHVSHSLKGGLDSTLTSGRERYDKLFCSMRDELQSEFGLSVEESARYPLIKRGSYRNLLYKLHDDGCRCNGFTIRVSSHLMEFDTRMRVAQFIMAKAIHDAIEPEHRLLPEEVKDMNRTSGFFGFADQKLEEVVETLYPQE